MTSVKQPGAVGLGGSTPPSVVSGLEFAHRRAGSAPAAAGRQGVASRCSSARHHPLWTASRSGCVHPGHSSGSAGGAGPPVLACRSVSRRPEARCCSLPDCGLGTSTVPSASSSRRRWSPSAGCRACRHTRGSGGEPDGSAAPTDRGRHSTSPDPRWGSESWTLRTRIRSRCRHSSRRRRDRLWRRRPVLRRKEGGTTSQGGPRRVYSLRQELLGTKRVPFRLSPLLLTRQYVVPETAGCDRAGAYSRLAARCPPGAPGTFPWRPSQQPDAAANPLVD